MIILTACPLHSTSDKSARLLSEPQQDPPRAVSHDVHVIMIPLQKWTSHIIAKGRREYPIMKLQFFEISLTRTGTGEPCVITVTNFLTGETRLCSPGMFQVVVCLYRPR